MKIGPLMIEFRKLLMNIVDKTDFAISNSTPYENEYTKSTKTYLAKAFALSKEIEKLSKYFEE